MTTHEIQSRLTRDSQAFLQEAVLKFKVINPHSNYCILEYNILILCELS